MTSGLSRSEEIRNRATQASRDWSKSVREISHNCNQTIKDEKRRNACKDDLLEWLLTYTPSAFYFKFSADHLQLISDTQKVLVEGGKYVTAMPRSSGKTSIFQRALIFAALNGHRRFPVLATADDKQFKRLFDGLKTILQTSQLLREDYPEVIEPILALENVAIRCIYQTWEGKPTHMKWGSDMMRFPTTDLTRERGNAGATISGGGLTGALRGMVVALPDGEMLRPDAILVDDPQTRQSAKSPSQVQEREDIMNGDLLGMAGAGKPISAICACTVIYKDDLSSRLLDNERSPGWKALKVSMLRSFPSHLDEWDKYDSVRRQELLGEIEEGATNAYYEEHREILDAGADHYWPERIDYGKVSAIQSAMDDYLENPRAFMAEKQNEPEDKIQSDIQPLDSLLLCRRMNGYRRGEVPNNCTVITCHVDVQQKLLYYATVAFTPQFGAYLIDMGHWPDQPRSYFTLGDVRKTYKSISKGNDDDGALRHAVSSLIKQQMTRRFRREDGTEMPINRMSIDSRWRPYVVDDGIKLSGHGNVYPAIGFGIRAKDKPLTQWIKKQGVQRGNHWTMHRPERRNVIALAVDVNYWKSEVHQALSVPIEHTSSLTFWRGKPSDHQMIADHCCAEFATRVEAKGRIVDEWDLPPSKPDNHHWDNLVGCFAIASTLGIAKEGISHAKPVVASKKRRVRQLKT